MNYILREVNNTTFFIITGQEPCPYIRVDNYCSIEEFLASRSRNLRKDINRQLRRLQEIGAIEYVVYEKETLDEALRILPKMLEIHSKRWPHAYKAPGFHKNLLQEGISAGLVNFCQLNLNGNPISWLISFVYKNRFYLYMPTICEEYDHYSPGKLLLAFCIKQAIEIKGIEVCDLMRGSEEYKNNWTKEIQTISNIACYSKSPVTKMKKLVMKLRKLL